MKECSGEKVLIVKVAQNYPLDSSSRWTVPGGQWDEGHEVVLHVQEEVYQSTLTLKRRIAGDQERFWFVSLSHAGSILTWTYSRTKYQSLGLTLLNTRSSQHFFTRALLYAQKLLVGWVGNERLCGDWAGGYVVGGPCDFSVSPWSKSFFIPFLRDIYSTWGSVGTGAWIGFGPGLHN